MGDFNSSVTRVWPVFETLLANDPTGIEWLPTLLEISKGELKRTMRTVRPILPELAKIERPIPRNLTKVLGTHRANALGSLRNCFEYDVPPTERFLRWLIENAKKMSWPRAAAAEKRFGEVTDLRRRMLIEGGADIQQEALSALASLGAKRSRRQWWAFEGFTSVDCYLETESLVLLIEGKRTEPISCATEWFPARNQVARNLETAMTVAGQKNKEYAVILCSEHFIELDTEVFKQSLPHFSTRELNEVIPHYLGCVTWSQIRDSLCPNLRLPNGLDDAIEICLSARARRSHLQ